MLYFLSLSSFSFSGVFFSSFSSSLLPFFATGFFVGFIVAFAVGFRVLSFYPERQRAVSGGASTHTHRKATTQHAVRRGAVRPSTP
jgi:hypothetical protein